MKKSRLHTIEELYVGQTYKETVVISSALLKKFVNLSKDSAPAHTDKLHSKKMGFERPIVHGFLAGLPFSRMLGMFLPGGNAIIHSVQLNYRTSVYVGDQLSYAVSIERLVPSVNSVELKLLAENQKGSQVISGKAICVVKA